jgi:Cu-Zn family superoxide dismutase
MKCRIVRFGAWLGLACLCPLVAPAGVAAAEPDKPAAEDEQFTPIERGSYLVHRVAMCIQCHSSRDSGGHLVDRGLLKGAPLPVASPFPYQIWAFHTPPLSGMPSGYSEDDMVTLLTQGRTKSGRKPLPPMPPFRFTERDARSIAAYLSWVGSQTEVKDVSIHQAKPEGRAVATLNAIGDSKVSGTVTFTWQKSFVHIEADLQGLTPGLHAIHIDEKGDCSDPSNGSTGGHFNPEGKPHGAPNAPDHHLGDLGNVVADEHGNARYERFDPRLTFQGDRSIVGRSVVVDAKMDDLKTQPGGASGGAVACGVIQRY